MSVQIGSQEFWFKEDVIRFRFLDNNLENVCETVCKFVVETWDSRSVNSYGFKPTLYVNGVPLSDVLRPDVFIGSVYDFVDNIPFYWLLMFGEKKIHPEIIVEYGIFPAEKYFLKELLHACPPWLTRP